MTLNLRGLWEEVFGRIWEDLGRLQGSWKGLGKALGGLGGGLGGILGGSWGRGEILGRSWEGLEGVFGVSWAPRLGNHRFGSHFGLQNGAKMVPKPTPN